MALFFMIHGQILYHLVSNSSMMTDFLRPSGNHQNKVICPGKWPQKPKKVPLDSDLVIFGMIIKGSKGTNVKKGLEFQQFQERKKSKRFEGVKRSKGSKGFMVSKCSKGSKGSKVSKVSKVSQSF